jgi:hypothetical protein
LEVDVNLAERQMSLTPWNDLRSGEGGTAARVPDELRIMLFGDFAESDAAYMWLENSAVSQHDLFECAPAVVAVIVAAVADRTIRSENLASSLDLLGRILGGHSAKNEVAAGLTDLRERCHAAASRGYWSLMEIAATPHEHKADWTAAAVLYVLDEEHVKLFLGDAT